MLSSRQKISGGGSVLWKPTPCSGVLTRKKYGSNDPQGLEKSFGWLAQRQPATSARPTEVDITERLLSKEPFEYFWDMRWLLKFPPNTVDLLRIANLKALLSKAKNIEHSIIEKGNSRYLIAPINNWWQPGIVQRFATLGNPPFAEKAVYSYADSLYDRPKDQHIGMNFVRVIDAI
jgi:hypothetical protein